MDTPLYCTALYYYWLTSYYMHIYHTIQCTYTYIDFPQVILDIEKVELGMSAGLQDRVIQSYGGLVHMDFSSVVPHTHKPPVPVPVFTELDPSLLPSMYLAYNMYAGKYSSVCFIYHIHRRIG